MQSTDRENVKALQRQREELLGELTVRSSDTPEKYSLLSEVVLQRWLTAECSQYTVAAATLQQELQCCHGNVRPLVADYLKCVRADKVGKRHVQNRRICIFM